jgi:hypothetical protein
MAGGHKDNTITLSSSVPNVAPHDILHLTTPDSVHLESAMDAFDPHELNFDGGELLYLFPSPSLSLPV